MARAHPVRFGIAGGSSLRSLAEIAAVARRAEAAGYSSFTANDHLHSHLAPLPVLAAAAAVTTDLRLGTLVLANDFRHPVMLAKEVATLDLVSDGRVELGIGAGWDDDDYETMGIRKDPAPVRIDRLREAVDVLRGAFAGEAFDYDGDHYTVRGLVGTPRPVSEPVPVVIGGGGRRILTLAAETADIVGVNLSFTSGRLGPTSGSTGTVDHVRERVAWVRDAAADRPVELQCRVHSAAIGDDTHAVLDAAVGATGMSPAELAASPYVLIGSVTEVGDKIERCAEELGLTYWVVPHDALEAFAPVVEALA